jgi:alkanesulfonate monooxygenase SsuD/methylene tetrahydromethanopterin reductase-like flavin-dependent oxidoreductase (luciferase family)
VHTVRRTIAASGVVARLARLADGLHAAPYQPPNCPAIVARYRIAFVPAARSSPQVVVTPSGCMTVGVTVAGAAQPPLWGDTGLIRAASRLLDIKP